MTIRLYLSPINPKRYFAGSISILINRKMSDREKQSFLHFIFCSEAKKILKIFAQKLTQEKEAWPVGI